MGRGRRKLARERAVTPASAGPYALHDGISCAPPQFFPHSKMPSGIEAYAASRAYGSVRGNKVEGTTGVGKTVQHISTKHVGLHEAVPDGGLEGPVQTTNHAGSPMFRAPTAHAECRRRHESQSPTSALIKAASLRPRPHPLREGRNQPATTPPRPHILVGSMAPSSPLRHHLYLLVVSISVLLASVPASAADGLPQLGGDCLHREILRDETVMRLKELGKISDGEGYLERTFLSPASIRATAVIISWMKDAGLTTWVDQMGNIHGRFEPANSTKEALLIGSHMDTVIDAGMYDGSLGIICAISALKVLKVTGKLHRLIRPVEVIAFSDEEGVRFQTTFLGSAAVAGTLPESILQVSDKSGTTVQDVLKMNSFEATAAAISQARYNPESVDSYVEVHMEQGPVLEALHYPLGVVKGIAGQTRLKVIVDGSQGHAGTVPMKLRRDPMVAAAELVVTLERLCKEPNKLLTYDEECGCFTEESLAGLVCTVGELLTWPSASNVIPGQVNFTVDIRAMDDKVRETIVTSFSRLVLQRCDDRLVDCRVEHKHSAPATPSDPELTAQLKRAVRSTVSAMPGRAAAAETPVLMSGAGHDAMAMAKLTKIGMLFVRCRGGVSHSPEESVTDDDVWAAGLALANFVEQAAVLSSEVQPQTLETAERSAVAAS